MSVFNKYFQVGSSSNEASNIPRKLLLKMLNEFVFLLQSFPLKKKKVSQNNPISTWADHFFGDGGKIWISRHFFTQSK